MNTRVLVMCTASALVAAGCIAVPGASVVKPGNVEVALGRRFDPADQQGRWVCQGMDIVLARGVLYELNRDYATTETWQEPEAEALPEGHARDTIYLWRVASDILVAFFVPPDARQPAIVRILAKVARSERTAEVQETIVCEPAPPAKVW